MAAHAREVMASTDSGCACRYVNTLLKLIPPVLGLQEQLRQAVQSGDMETSHGICRIAVALGENHSRWVLGMVPRRESELGAACCSPHIAFSRACPTPSDICKGRGVGPTAELPL